jgi:hypothetical protein
LIEESEYALVFQSGVTMLRVQRIGPFEPHPFTALGWDVPDIRATVAELEMRVKDPDGNALSLTQFV